MNTTAGDLPSKNPSAPTGPASYAVPHEIASWTCPSSSAVGLARFLMTTRSPSTVSWSITSSWTKTAYSAKRETALKYETASCAPPRPNRSVTSPISVASSDAQIPARRPRFHAIRPRGIR
ncbi:MAG: hypothetical protein U0V56_13160 [Actinomycetota bacterium]